MQIGCRLCRRRSGLRRDKAADKMPAARRKGLESRRKTVRHTARRSNDRFGLNAKFKQALSARSLLKISYRANPTVPNGLPLHGNGLPPAPQDRRVYTFLNPKSSIRAQSGFVLPPFLCPAGGTPVLPSGHACATRRAHLYPSRETSQTASTGGKRKQTPAGCRQKRYKIVHFIKYYSPPCLISCKKALILKPLTPLFPA